MIGEFGVPSNDGRWLDAQKNMLNYMNANSLHATAWSGGAWWPTDYAMFTAAPGKTDSAFENLLEGYDNQFSGFGTGTGLTLPPPVSPTPVTGTPTVSVNDLAVSENAGSATFTIARSGDLSKASSVNYSTANGSAGAGTDFTYASGTISFAAGEAMKTVTVGITNDTIVEGNETFSLNLSGGTNVTIADGSGTATINNDDGGSTTIRSVPAGFPTGPTIWGGDGNDTINADWSRVDYVDAKGGDDLIIGVGSKDYIDGGTGNDTVSYHWSGAFVDVDLMRATQANGDANGDVLTNIENLTGSGKNDRLAGDDLANIINGLGGRDVLSGRGGNDRFVFDSAANASGDTVTDFTSGDQLDFRLMDANSNAAGDQAFTWLDTGAFTGSAGQLRQYDVRGLRYVAGDVNGDGIADFTIELAGNVNLKFADILL
jgi:chitinase